MNKVKTLSFAIVLAAAPAAANAATERNAIEACTAAAMAELPNLSADQTAWTIDESSNASDRRLEKAGVFYFDIRNPENGEIVARADCRFNRSGKVRSVTQVPVGAEDASERAKAAF